VRFALKEVKNLKVSSSLEFWHLVGRSNHMSLKGFKNVASHLVIKKPRSGMELSYEYKFQGVVEISW
jgi:hypothetical protein